MNRRHRTPPGALLGALALALSPALVAAEPDGQAIYSAKCALCHGADGVAKPTWAKKGAKNLNDPAWQKETTDEAITKIINEGNAEKKMPAYKGKLTPEEIASVVGHVRQLAPKP